MGRNPQEPDHQQALLDRALEDTFPASDPPAVTDPSGGTPSEIIPLRQGDALLVVDVQVDFCPGGSLPIPAGDEIVPVLNAWIDAAERTGVPVFASRDWHPPDHLSFAAQDAPWPPHCIAHTPGAAYHPHLRLPADTVSITKGDRSDRDQYSAFDGTGLADQMRGRGVRRVWIGGLAQDVCVLATATDAVKAGFETHLIPSASKPVTQAGGAAALAEMARAGVVVDATDLT